MQPAEDSSGEKPSGCRTDSVLIILCCLFVLALVYEGTVYASSHEGTGLVHAKSGVVAPVTSAPQPTGFRYKDGPLLTSYGSGVTLGPVGMLLRAQEIASKHWNTVTDIVDSGLLSFYVPSLEKHAEDDPSGKDDWLDFSGKESSRKDRSSAKATMGWRDSQLGGAGIDIDVLLTKLDNACISASDDATTNTLTVDLLNSTHHQGELVDHSFDHVPEVHDFVKFTGSMPEGADVKGRTVKSGIAVLFPALDGNPKKYRSGKVLSYLWGVTRAVNSVPPDSDEELVVVPLGSREPPPLNKNPPAPENVRHWQFKWFMGLLEVMDKAFGSQTVFSSSWMSYFSAGLSKGTAKGNRRCFRSLYIPKSTKIGYSQDTVLAVRRAQLDLRRRVLAVLKAEDAEDGKRGKGSTETAEGTTKDVVIGVDSASGQRTPLTMALYSTADTEAVLVSNADDFIKSAKEAMNAQGANIKVSLITRFLTLSFKEQVRLVRDLDFLLGLDTSITSLNVIFMPLFSSTHLFRVCNIESVVHPALSPMAEISFDTQQVHYWKFCNQNENGVVLCYSNQCDVLLNEDFIKSTVIPTIVEDLPSVRSNLNKISIGPKWMRLELEDLYVIHRNSAMFAAKIQQLQPLVNVFSSLQQPKS